MSNKYVILGIVFISFIFAMIFILIAGKSFQDISDSNNDNNPDSEESIEIVNNLFRVEEIANSKIIELNNRIIELNENTSIKNKYSLKNKIYGIVDNSLGLICLSDSTFCTVYEVEYKGSLFYISSPSVIKRSSTFGTEESEIKQIKGEDREFTSEIAESFSEDGTSLGKIRVQIFGCYDSNICFYSGLLPIELEANKNFENLFIEFIEQYG